MPDVYDPIQSQMSVKSSQEILADYITDLEARSSVELWLYQTNVAPAPGNTLAHILEATFSGYTRATIASWGVIGVDTSNNAFSTAGLQTFACNGGGVNNSVYGSALTATVEGGLQASATNTGSGTGYSPIFTIVDAGAGYTAAPKVSLTGSAGSGAAAHSVLNANGTVNSIVLDSAGVGYSSYTVVIDEPYELIKQNVLSSTGISMSQSTDLISTYTQLIQPSNAA